jgi:nicotinamide mononucleotide transporter
MNFFDHEHIFFYLWDYGISYIEFFGLLSGIIAVTLSAFANVWNWLIGIVNVVLSFLLFYQVQLYPDMFLMVFFFFTNVIGWWRWTHPTSNAEADVKHELKISFLRRQELAIGLIIGLLGTIALGLFARNLHGILPQLFTLPSAYPFFDSFITVMSIVGTFYAIRKKIEVWIVWLMVDAIGTWLYFMRDIRLYAVLYFVYFILAAFGLYHWIREYRSYQHSKS